MDSIQLNSNDSSEETIFRLQTIKNLLNNQNGNLSLNVLIDLFQNLILDCKSVISHNNNNRYFLNIYQIYKAINEQLYNLRLNVDDFYTLKVIGQGAFGQVQLVRHCETKKLYAMKILNKSQMLLQEGSVFWKEERDIMTGIDSRWIVKLHYAFQNPKRLYMVMEYLPGGNLVNWMSKIEDVSEADVCFYAAEIVLAVCVLHEYNFVHRDIKPDNMLLDCRGHIKLADFGTCVRIDPVTKHITCNRAVGTPDYISPEVLQSQNGNTGYGREVDWWSLGVMLYEIFYGDPPFYSETLVLTYGKIMVHEQYLTFPPDDQISDRAISLIRGLICDRSVRLGSSDGAHDIKSHEFFNNSSIRWNWNNIHEFESPFIPTLENELDTSNFDSLDDDESKESFNNNDKELTSTVFTGENLQFSGFSYGDIFNQTERRPSKNGSVLTEKIVDESVNNTIAENQYLTSKVHSLGKENQDIKSSLEKLSIERKDLEIQIQNALAKLKTEIGISKKLQTDYSDLMLKHGMCQQKFSRLEEEKHKLCADLASIQNNSNEESRRYLSQIEQQQTEFNSLEYKLQESQTEYRKSKLEKIKLENDIKYLQKRCDALEQEIARQSNNGPESVTSTPTSGSTQTSRLDLELKELQQQAMEILTLSNLTASLQKDNDMMKMSLARYEDQLSKERDSVNTLNSLIKEKNSIIEDLKVSNVDYNKKLESSTKSEKEATVKLFRLTKLKVDDKQKYDNDLEDQRKKLNTIITNKSQEIQQLTRNLELSSQENGSLKSDLQLEKAKCSGLVEKINDILTGKSTTAREMMLAEEMKSGKVDRRSGRYYNQVLKENKRLQSLYNQLEKDSTRKEKELKAQIEHLTREKDHLESENVSLKSNVAYYENIGIGESPANRASVVTYSSHGSYDSGFPIDVMKATSTPIRSSVQHTKPPLFHMSSMNMSPMSSSHTKPGINVQLRNEKDNDKFDSTIRLNKTKTFDFNRHSISESLVADFPCPEGQLDVNVKVKGKKMSWEKRFVKIDSQNLMFYNQSLETCILKLPLSSLVFVRQATNADIIHAKKGEIPRIFQICYDKNRTIYSEVMMKQSLSGSNCSIDTLGSSKSGEESIVNDLNDVTLNEYVQKQGSRKSSVSKFLPIFGSKHKPKGEELSLNSINAGAVFLKGHVFQPCNGDLKSNCVMCKRPLNQPLLSSTAGSTITSSSSENSHDLRVIMDTGVRLMSTSRTVDLLSSTVDPCKAYKCYHCSMSVHGTDLDEKIMTACKDSVAIQLCRTSSEQQLAEWVACLCNVIKSQQNQHNQAQSISTPSTSRSDFKTRSATLG